MVSSNCRKIFSLICTIAALFVCASSHAATITVTTDRDPVGLNESFMMTFESDSSVDSEPEFSPLNKDFQILSRNSSSSMSIINGKISSSKKWQLTVLARRTGKLTIPAIRFGQDRSQASFVNVTNGGGAPRTSNSSQDIFIEVVAEPIISYVQAEVIYTVRLYLAVATSNASLSEPGISGASAVIERLGEDKNFQTNKRGKRYNVVERRYAIYPQVSGSMTIEPVMFQGQINRNAFSLFDPFGPQPKTIIERSAALTLDVKTVPGQFPGGHWLPATSVTLSESWSQDPPTFQVGEPLTRTLTLTAEGQTASQLLELPEWVPAAFKQYPDQPTLQDDKSDSGITATRQEKVAIIPNRAGEYVLPEIVLPWWNTKTNQLEYASIAEQKITVAGAVHDNGAAMPRPDETDIVPEKNNADVFAPVLPADDAETGSAAGFWQGLSAGLAVAWLCTLLLWWRGRRGGNGEAIEEKDNKRLKQLLKDVQQACKSGQADRAKQALLLWGKHIWPESPPTSLGDIGGRCPAALAEKIAELNTILYSRRKGSWDGEQFWQVFLNSHTASGKQAQKQTGELEPLYRL